jgi:hypothetical protein
MPIPEETDRIHRVALTLWHLIVQVFDESVMLQVREDKHRFEFCGL